MIDFLFRAGRFIVAATRHAASGFAEVDEDEQAFRLATCQVCEFSSRETSEHWICGKCGCLLQAKTLWHSESCPIGKW